MEIAGYTIDVQNNLIITHVSSKQNDIFDYGLYHGHMRTISCKQSKH